MMVWVVPLLMVTTLLFRCFFVGDIDGMFCVLIVAKSGRRDNIGVIV